MMLRRVVVGVVRLRSVASIVVADADAPCRTALDNVVRGSYSCLLVPPRDALVVLSLFGSAHYFFWLVENGCMHGHLLIELASVIFTDPRAATTSYCPHPDLLYVCPVSSPPRRSGFLLCVASCPRFQLEMETPVWWEGMKDVEGRTSDHRSSGRSDWRQESDEDWARRALWTAQGWMERERQQGRR